jgi:hypothetical protein
MHGETMTRILAFLAAALLLAGCATRGSAPSSLDPLAAEYVKLQLAIGEKEEGYIDAYYGPAEWQAAAKAAPRSLAELAFSAATLSSRIQAVSPARMSPIERRRRDFLLANLTAARTRLRMLQGDKLSFADEAEGLFGYRPELKPLSHYDGVLARIERLVPGAGPLPARLETLQSRLTIPRDKLDSVMRTAIAECRRRTVRHIDLPAQEKFTLEFVTNKSWSGYNYYQGNANSLIQINTDLPIRIGRAVDLGCHEGYPGHHVHNMLLEQKLARERGWVEYTLYPLYSPQSFIAEGSANYGIELAFPGPERLAFETGTLYPIAGLPVSEGPRYLELLQATEALSGARFTIAREFLEGRMTREQAVAATEKYQLTSRARAEQSIKFTEQYRSYVINYGLGLDLVKSYIEAAGPSQEARWKAMERVLSEPTLPRDLVRR